MIRSLDDRNHTRLSFNSYAVAYLGVAGMARAMGDISTGGAKIAWQKVKYVFTVS